MRSNKGGLDLLVVYSAGLSDPRIDRTKMHAMSDAPPHTQKSSAASARPSSSLEAAT